MRGYTSIEQSKKLVELGLNPETADQFYYAKQRFDGNEYVNTGYYFHCFREEKIPACCYDDDEIDNEEHFQYLLKTFGASKYDDDDNSFIPCWSLAALLELMPKSNSIGCSLILDENYLALDDCAKNFHIDINGDTLIDVAFNAIVYMLENGYIEKK